MNLEHPHNPLCGLEIDRLAERRDDPQWLDEAYRHPQARLVLAHHGRLLVRRRESRSPLLEFRAADLQDHIPYSAFLGRRRERPYFLASIEADQAASVARLLNGEFAGLRRIASELDADQAALASYARALDLWHASHHFCGRCGSLTESRGGGFRRLCSNPECGAQHFPRLDPAVIVIVTHGERCLLGRQPSWPALRYSTLAGFVEPGESLEEAVRREVAEEAGVELQSVNYHSSQPWPFPASLMLGFTAEAATTRISKGEELEDVRWFAIEELADAVRNGKLLLPFRSSVSFRLIAHWLAAEHGVIVGDWLPGRLS